jgi:hypothetical protein
MVTITARSAESTYYIWNFFWAASSATTSLTSLSFFSPHPLPQPYYYFTLFIPRLIYYLLGPCLLLSQTTSSYIDICVLPFCSEEFAGRTIEAWAWYTAESISAMPFQRVNLCQIVERDPRSYLGMDSP